MIFDNLVKKEQTVGPIEAAEVVSTPAVKGYRKPVFSYNFVNGVTFDVQGDPDSQYLLQIREDKEIIHQSIVQGNNWIKGYFQYYRPYTLKAYGLTEGEVVFDHTLDLIDKRVVVELSSKALGDTLAWLPYLEEFQKLHQCELIGISHHNKLFQNQYPTITFLEPGSAINDVNAWYVIGWFYKEIEGKDGKPVVTEDVNLYKNPRDFKKIPLQATASDILGLPYTEIKPRLNFSAGPRPMEKKYVTIANHGTLQAKYWNNPLGWQEVVDYLKFQGYEVVLLSKEENGSNGNYNPTGVLLPTDYELETIMNYMYHSDLFIGIGSGLTWLSWALNVPTVLISGFSDDYTEMKTGITRVSAPAGACHGCFNTTKLQNDGKWDWCPVHGTDDQKFECTTTISGQDVIDAIEPLLLKETKLS